MNHHRIFSPQRAQQWLHCMHLTVETGRIFRPPPWRKAPRRPKAQQLELLVAR